MSLINDYLQKTENSTQRTHQNIEVPPALISTPKKKFSGARVQMAVVLITSAVAAGVYLKFSSEIHQAVVGIASDRETDHFTAPNSATFTPKPAPASPSSSGAENPMNTVGGEKNTLMPNKVDSVKMDSMATAPLYNASDGIPQAGLVMKDPESNPTKAFSPSFISSPGARISTSALSQEPSEPEQTAPVPSAYSNSVVPATHKATPSPTPVKKLKTETFFSTAPEKIEAALPSDSSTGSAPRRIAALSLPLKQPRASAAPAEPNPDATQSQPTALAGSAPVENVPEITSEKIKAASPGILKPPAPASPSKDSERLYQLGLMAQQEKKTDAARRYYEELLRRDPEHTDALINLSVLFLGQGRYDKATPLLEKANEVDPENPKVLINLGIIELKKGNLHSAQTYFERAIAIDFENETALLNLAYIHQRRNEPALTEKYLKAAIGVSPENVETLLSYAGFLEKNNRFPDAVTIYQRCLTIESIRSDLNRARVIRDRINSLAYYIRQHAENE